MSNQSKTEKCNSCPRHCNINRANSTGFCKENDKIRIAKVIEHFQWEEPCLSRNKQGTLAIFFSGCNLKCDYCQNYAISRGGVGKEYSIEEFCKLIEAHQDQHSSIDLITPTHFSSSLIKAFAKIEKHVPVIWNTNGYETVENIKEISSFVDIFLTDLKYSNDELGKKFSMTNDYFSSTLPAIKEMCNQKSDIFEDDFLKQGVIIRHLVLPGFIPNSLETLNIIKKHFHSRIVSLMSQFTPNGKSSLDRKLLPIEYKTVLSHLQKLGLENGYIQDFDSANDCFVPDFL